MNIILNIDVCIDVICLQTCLDNVFNVKVTKHEQTRTYSLDELLELQNKLMLMSSKGEHGKEQVNKFTQVGPLHVSQKDPNSTISYATLYLHNFVKTIKVVTVVSIL